MAPLMQFGFAGNVDVSSSVRLTNSKTNCEQLGFLEIGRRAKLWIRAMKRKSSMLSARCKELGYLNKDQKLELGVQNVILY